MSKGPVLTSGIHLPNYGKYWSDLDLGASAQLVEEVGFGSVWLSDHVVLVEDARSHYPFSLDGKFFLAPDQDWLDWVTTASYLAARTTKIDIGVAVCVLPLRNPLVLAKQVATIDQLSGGRIRLGVGAGWLKEEFEAVGQVFSQRGRALDGGIQILQQAWTGSPEPGTYGIYELPPGVRCYPMPKQSPLPLYVGGTSQAAFRRVAEYATGWYGTAPGGRMDPGEVEAAVASINQQCERFHRDTTEIDIALRVAVAAKELGTAELRETLLTYVRAGVTRFSFDVGWRPEIDMGARLEALMNTFSTVCDATT